MSLLTKQQAEQIIQSQLGVYLTHNEIREYVKRVDVCDFSRLFEQYRAFNGDERRIDVYAAMMMSSEIIGDWQANGKTNLVIDEEVRDLLPDGNFGELIDPDKIGLRVFAINTAVKILWSDKSEHLQRAKTFTEVGRNGREILIKQTTIPDGLVDRRAGYDLESTPFPITFLIRIKPSGKVIVTERLNNVRKAFRITEESTEWAGTITSLRVLSYLSLPNRDVERNPTKALKEQKTILLPAEDWHVGSRVGAAIRKLPEDARRKGKAHASGYTIAARKKARPHYVPEHDRVLHRGTPEEYTIRVRAHCKCLPEGMTEEEFWLLPEVYRRCL